MEIKTGFGYYVKDGKKLHKYELSKGTHPDPVGYTVVEVASQVELDAITLDKSDGQIEAEKKAQRDVIARQGAINKLRAFGLTEEEVLAILAK